MPCTCTHNMDKHTQLSGKCNEFGCKCDKYILDMDENAKRQPWYMKQAVMSLKKLMSGIEDILCDYQPFTVVGDSKEYVQQFPDTGVKARASEIAILIMEKDFDPEIWKERRSIDIQAAQTVAEFQRAKLVHHNPKFILDLITTCMKAEGYPKRCKDCPISKECKRALAEAKKKEAENLPKLEHFPLDDVKPEEPKETPKEECSCQKS